MKVVINVKHFVAMLISWAIAFATISGILQEHVEFAGPLNELVFFVLAMVLGTMCLFASFEKYEKK
jgi:hypothetical protein